MKVLSKINRGVILTAAVLLGVSAYLIGLEISHRAAREEIQQLCESYVTAELKYHMLPEAYRTQEPEMPPEELEHYLAAMRQEIKNFYVSNEQTYRYKLEDLETDLIAQSEGEGVVYQFKKEIVGCEIEFDGSIANVTLTSMTTYDGAAAPYKKGMTLSSRQTLAGETFDQFTFQQEEGRWKLAYAVLYGPEGSKTYTSNVY